MIAPDERRHVLRGSREGERPGGAGTVDAIALTSGRSGELLDRAREVLLVVIDQQAGEWPSLETWRNLLPEWFVEACSPELSQEEAEAEAERWHSLSAEARAAEHQDSPWTLADWLYWLEPHERQWFWWDATVESADRVRVTVEVPGWPAPLGALEWLLRAAGATRVDVE